jgi:hypothetical protein
MSSGDTNRLTKKYYLAVKCAETHRGIWIGILRCTAPQKRLCLASGSSVSARPSHAPAAEQSGNDHSQEHQADIAEPRYPAHSGAYAIRCHRCVSKLSAMP